MSEWKVYKLEDIVSFSQGFQISTDQQYEVKEKYMDRFIRIVDYTNKNEKPRYIKKIDKRYWAYKDDVVMIRYGSNTAGKVVRGLSGYIANNMFKVNIIDNNILDKEFLYYFLSQERIYKYLKNSQSSSTMPAIKFSDLYKIDAYLPIIEQQRKVATFLNFINEKTQLNTQINQTLEAIAQAIFKSWFVDFDPVRAKAQALSEGKSEREANLSAMAVISGKTIEDLSQTEYQELWEIADAFPSELVENAEFGEVPKGWGIAPLSTFGEIICGKTPTKSKSEYYGNNIPFIKIPDMHGKVFITQTIDNLSLIGANSQATKYISKGSICVSCIATVGLVSLVSRKSQTNQQINSIVPNNLNFSEYLYLYLSQSEMNKYMKSLASGGSATLNMNTSTFSSIQILKPNNEILDLFHKKSLDIFEKILKNEENNQILAQTRDLLLPKLLSGEIEL